VQDIKTATPLTEDLAVIAPHRLLVQALVEQLRVSLQAIERFDAEITTLAQTFPDYSLFRALPGAGATLAPRLLAADPHRDARRTSDLAVDVPGLRHAAVERIRRRRQPWRATEGPPSGLRRRHLLGEIVQGARCPDRAGAAACG
jgi:hypothetical protein